MWSGELSQALPSKKVHTANAVSQFVRFFAGFLNPLIFLVTPPHTHPLASHFLSRLNCALSLFRERVRKEVFGQELKGAHRSGSEGAALAVIGYSVAAYTLYAMDTNAFTGFLLGVWMGCRVGM